MTVNNKWPNMHITKTTDDHGEPSCSQVDNILNLQLCLLSTEFFIDGPSELFPHLSLLFTESVTHGAVPDDLCLTTTVPIPKPGSYTRESSSYRGIAQFYFR
jgi:hypothetical protein